MVKSIDQQHLTRNRSAPIIAGLILLALAARLLPGPRTIDDAFITFRYSRNLVDGLGFVYNPGERVLGTTTPLFTLLLAAVSHVLGGQDFPQYALIISGLADGVTAALLYTLARRATEYLPIALLPGALWAIAPRSVTFAVGGMETSVNILWMVGAVWLYVNHRPVWTGVFAGLGALTRIDSGLWITPLLGWQLIEQWRTTAAAPLRKRLPYRTWLAGGVTVLPWLIFSTAYFGSPIPRSLAAKSAAYTVEPLSGLVQFIQAYATPFFEFDTLGSTGAIAGSAAYLTLSGFGILYAAHRTPRLLPFLIYPWLYLLAFSLANPLIFRWYLVPPMPALILGILLGAWSLLHNLRQVGAARFIRPLAVGALALLWGGMSLNGWDAHPDHGADRPAPRMAWHQIELYYARIGTQLRDEYGVTGQTRVASADIGAVGYFSGATILDTVGLVTPDYSRYYPVDAGLIVEGQNYAVPPELILDSDPAYFVTMEAFVRLGLEREAEFQRGYTLLAEIPTDFYGSGMRLYGRVS